MAKPYPSRRVMLLGLGAGLLGGCTRPPQPPSTPEPTPDGTPQHSASPAPDAAGTTPPPATTAADARVLGSAIAAERALLGLYASVLDAHPRLGRRLRPVVAHHEAHLAALADAAGTATKRRGRPSPSPRDTAARKRDIPRSPAAALAALVRAERDAARARAGDAVSVSPASARLLASVAAAEAAHAALLGSPP